MTIKGKKVLFVIVSLITVASNCDKDPCLSRGLSSVPSCGKDYTTQSRPLMTKEGVRISCYKCIPKLARDICPLYQLQYRSGLCKERQDTVVLPLRKKRNQPENNVVVCYQCVKG